MSEIMEKRNDALRKLREFYEKNEVENNSERCSELLKDLAKSYQETDQWSLVCKCALLNGAMIGTSSKDRKECIKSQLGQLGESLLVERNRDEVDLDIVEFSLKLKNKLCEKRIEIGKKLSDMQPIPTETCGSDLISKEKEVIRNARFLMKEISEFYAKLMEEISTKCTEVLGKPPCQFSHFGMGSLARQETTLYSDFENAIVLGEGVDWINESSREEAIEYFCWYAVLFEMIMINFGETPISLVGIEGLNDHYSTDKSNNWFYDSFISRGAMFDSCLPYGRKQARKKCKPEAIELILPADEMLGYLKKPRTLQEGYHFTNMLLDSRHIAGDKDLFQKFRAGYVEIANDLRKSIPYVQQDLCCTKESLGKYSFSKTFSSLTYLSSISAHIPFLCRLYGIFGYPSPSHMVESLTNDFNLSNVVAHNLLYAIAVANLVRLKRSARHDKQSDQLAGAVNLIDDASQKMNIFDAVGESSALAYYEISFGVRNSIKPVVEILEFKIQENEPIDGNAAITCFEKHLTERQNFKLHGDAYHHFQNFEKATASYKLALAACKKADGMFSRDQECEILMSLGLTNLHALKFRNSLSWYGILIGLERKQQRGDISLRNIAIALTMSGQCATELPLMRPNYPKYIEEAEDIWQRLLSSDPDNKDYIKGLADLRDTEAFYFLRTYKYNESLEKYTEAKALFANYFGQDVTNDDTLKVENGIAMCLLRLERFEEAVEIFDRIIPQKRSMIGKEAADVNVSWYLRHKGMALFSLGKYQEAVDAYEESIKIRFRAPGPSYHIYAATANTTRLLAECHYQFEHYEEAILSSERVLKLVEKIPGSVKGKEFKGIAEKIMLESREKLRI